MSYSIRAKQDFLGPWLFEKTFVKYKEFQKVQDLCVGREPFSAWKGSFQVVRTDTCSNFCKDFFFPNTLEALKIKKFADKIFLALVYFVFDLVTLPIRCITLIPRYFSNIRNSRENHPLHKYFVQQNANPQLLNRDRIFLEDNDGYFTYGRTFPYVDLPKNLTAAGDTLYPDDEYLRSNQLS